MSALRCEIAHWVCHLLSTSGRSTWSTAFFYFLDSWDVDSTWSSSGQGSLIGVECSSSLGHGGWMQPRSIALVTRSPRPLNQLLHSQLQVLCWIMFHDWPIGFNYAVTLRADRWAHGGSIEINRVYLSPRHQNLMNRTSSTSGTGAQMTNEPVLLRWIPIYKALNTLNTKCWTMFHLNNNVGSLLS